MSDSQQAVIVLSRPNAIEIDKGQADLLTQIEEGQYSEVKATAISAAKLSHTISAFANTDGGDLYIGISEQLLGGNATRRDWDGFPNVEAASGHLQAFEKAFPLGKDFQYEFLRCAKRRGLVLHVQVSRTHGVIRATDGKAYVRRGAMNLPQDAPEQLRRLEFTKGVISFEGHPVQVPIKSIINSPITKQFLHRVVPKAQPEAWLRKQQLIVNEMPTVAGLLLFADELQAVLPKRCGIKVYRYKTQEETGFRDVLSFIPITVRAAYTIKSRKQSKSQLEKLKKSSAWGRRDWNKSSIRLKRSTKSLPTPRSTGITVSPMTSTCAFLITELRFKAQDAYLHTSHLETSWMNALRATGQSFACLTSFPIHQTEMLARV